MGKYNWLAQILIIWAILLLPYILLMSVYDAIAETSDTSYMVLRPKMLGYDFDCLDYNPYLDRGEMLHDDENGFSELKETPQLIAQVIEVAYCHVDNIYLDSDDKYFRFGFSERVTDGHENHRHPTRGAYWVEYER